MCAIRKQERLGARLDTRPENQLGGADAWAHTVAENPCDGQPVGPGRYAHAVCYHACVERCRTSGDEHRTYDPTPIRGCHATRDDALLKFDLAIIEKYAARKPPFVRPARAVDDGAAIQGCGSARRVHAACDSKASIR
eukprot:4609604-Prymnesium_polylepis.2